ncbi:hypothetical protein CEXT_83071 [Caerostris extrusa]|uniref:Uncharacterized protein n=1 Tax=Caerostris extrusa TaxID=172846 RepID=A0AAV4SGC7_CAEEX|nr:hypothetical protein CEXT_83071 [Caerostris extrusa]
MAAAHNGPNFPILFYERMLLKGYKTASNDDHEKVMISVQNRASVLIIPQPGTPINSSAGQRDMSLHNGKVTMWPLWSLSLTMAIPHLRREEVSLTVEALT